MKLGVNTFAHRIFHGSDDTYFHFVFRLYQECVLTRCREQRSRCTLVPNFALFPSGNYSDPTVWWPRKHDETALLLHIRQVAARAAVRSWPIVDTADKGIRPAPLPKIAASVDHVETACKTSSSLNAHGDHTFARRPRPPNPDSATATTKTAK